MLCLWKDTMLELRTGKTCWVWSFSNLWPSKCIQMQCASQNETWCQVGSHSNRAWKQARTIQLEYNYNDVPPISSAYHCYTACGQVWDSLPDRGFENAPSNLDKSADLPVRNQLRPSVLPGISECACQQWTTSPPFPITQVYVYRKLQGVCWTKIISSQTASSPGWADFLGWMGWGRKLDTKCFNRKNPSPKKKPQKQKIFLPNRFRHHRNPPTAALNFGTRLGLWLSRWFPKPATPRWDGWVRRVAFSNHDKAMAMRVFYLVASGKRWWTDFVIDKRDSLK